MQKIRILDDIYWEKIYKELIEFLPYFEYPVKENVKSPIPYLSKIKNWDIVLLDNFFPWEVREEPLWDDFLWQYLKLWYECKIIWISDYWKHLTKRFEQRCIAYNQGHVIWFVSSKDWKEIAEMIAELIL